MPSSGGTTGTPVTEAGLVTLQEAKDYMALQQDAFDVYVNDRIMVASNWVQETCGRLFKAITDQTLSLWPNQMGSVDVVDLWPDPVPVVAVDTLGDRTYATVLEAGSYEFLPFRKSILDPERYQEIRKLSSYDYFDPRYPVQVSEASWGYVDSNNRAPYQVRLAVLMGLARFWKRKEVPLGLMQMPAIGFRRMLDEDPQIKELLEEFIHPQKKRGAQ